MIPELEARKLLEELDMLSLPVIPENICMKIGIHYREDSFKNIFLPHNVIF